MIRPPSGPPALMAGVEFKGNALILPPDIERDRWGQLRIVLSTVEGAPLWWWGDWLTYGQDKWQADYSLAEEVSGYKRKTLYEAAYVARNVPIPIRMETLSWGHHQVVAALTDAGQRYWLGKALEGSWTVAELRFAMHAEGEAAPPSESIHYSSDDDEWYTPPEVVAAVVAFFGTIDLDPCAESRDDPTVPALMHFTAADDGLSRPWSGKVYMNPPYGEEIAQWVTKLHAHYQAGDLDAAIALVPARVDTRWWGHLRNYAACFISGRLHFSGHSDSAPFPSVLVYLGDDIARYAAVMSPLGDVWTRYRGRDNDAAYTDTDDTGTAGADDPGAPDGGDEPPQ